MSVAPPQMQNENATDGWSRAVRYFCNSTLKAASSWLHSSEPSRCLSPSSLYPLHLLDYGRCTLLRIASSDHVLSFNHLPRCPVAWLTKIVHNEPLRASLCIGPCVQVILNGARVSGAIRSERGDGQCDLHTQGSSEAKSKI